MQTRTHRGTRTERANRLDGKWRGAHIELILLFSLACVFACASELEKKFTRLSRAKAELTVNLDDLLTELVPGDPGRRDRSLAFFQVLVLVSLDVIRVRQDAHFGDIAITKGPKWAVRFSSSQMFSDTPTQ